MVLYFPGYSLWRSVDLVNRTLWIGSKTFWIGFPQDFLPWETSASEFHNSHNILVITFSSFWEVARVLLFIWLFINLVMRKQTLVSSLTTRYFSSSTHFDLVIRLAQKAWRQCVLVFVRDSWVSWGKLHRSPCEHWPFSFHWSQIPVLPVTFRFLTTAPDSILLCPASKFRKRSFWSFLLFTIVFFLKKIDNWVSISSDESPCRTIPIRFWVTQTHVFLICTILPRYRQVESLSLIIKFRPTLYRIPEYRHFEDQ